MSPSFNDFIKSLAPLTKYFHIYRKSEIFASVEEGLTSLENGFLIDYKDQDINYTDYKWVVRKSCFELNVSKETPKQIYYVDQLGKITFDDDKADPSQLILVLKSHYVLIDQKSIAHEYNVIQFLRDLQSFSNIFEIYSDIVTFSEQIREFIQEGIRASSKRANQFLRAFKAYLSRKFKSKHGIGKGVEGYIPFRTWARGSLNSQLVNSLVFVDKLSQLKVCYGDN